MRISYRTCVLGGCAIAIAMATLFATRAGLTPLLWIAIAAFAVCTSFFLAAMTKVLFGTESFAFLHYQIASIAVTAALLPEALNLLALTLAIAQAFGRIGCASAGCCYGRRGIPVQRIESAALFTIAAFCAARIDDAFVIYIVAYAATRFALEFLRGDRRRHFRGLSEAQWICLATLSTMIPLWSAATAVAAFLARAAARAPNQIHFSHGTTANTDHFTLSSDKPLTGNAVAAFVSDRVPANAQLTLIPRPRGIWHVIARSC